MLINYAKKITDKESVIKQRDTNKKLLEDLEGVSEIRKPSDRAAEGVY